jgi:hypothetical protein
VVEHLFRHEAGKMVATLTRIFGIEHLTLDEDVVQEALARALQTWPFYGVPQNADARGWQRQSASPPGAGSDALGSTVDCAWYVSLRAVGCGGGDYPNASLSAKLLRLVLRTQSRSNGKTGFIFPELCRWRIKG